MALPTTRNRMFGDFFAFPLTHLESLAPSADFIEADEAYGVEGSRRERSR